VTKTHKPVTHHKLFMTRKKWLCWYRSHVPAVRVITLTTGFLHQQRLINFRHESSERIVTLLDQSQKRSVSMSTLVFSRHYELIALASAYEAW